MKRLIAGLLVIPVLTMLGGLVGCGKEEKPNAPRAKLPVPGGDGAKGGAPKTAVKPGTAKVVGKVVLDGELPKIASLEEKMKGHSDNATCLAGSEAEKMDPTWMIGKERGVANAVIWLSPPADKEFEVVKTAGDAVIDQPHCLYIPHVVVVKPGQKLLINNSANVLHNTLLTVDGFANPRGFGESIPANKSVPVDWLSPQDSVINVGCQIHAWMTAKLWVMPHQYVAITKEDGSFEIANVPEGVELAVVAWHEGASPNYFYGAGKKGKKHTFKAGDNPPLELKVKAP